MSLCRKIHQILVLITVFSFVSCSENENMEVKIVNEPSEGDVLSREAKKGKQELEDGSLYEGEMVAGKPSGHGQRSYPNGDLYEGQFKKVQGMVTVPIVTKRTNYWKDMLACGQMMNGMVTVSLFLRIVLVSRVWNRSNLVYGDYEGADGEVQVRKMVW